MSRADELNCVFVYGSLVGDLTLSGCVRAQSARLDGWARQWRHSVTTEWGNTCALTVSREAGATVNGSLLHCRASAMKHLDRREVGYRRLHVTSVRLPHPRHSSTAAEIYVSEANHLSWASDEHPIWLSYVRTVAVGFLRTYGQAGLDEFVTGTQGWDGPLLDDSGAPRYPRVVLLTAEETGAIDSALRQAGANWKRGLP